VRKGTLVPKQFKNLLEWVAHKNRVDDASRSKSLPLQFFGIKPGFLQNYLPPKESSAAARRLAFAHSVELNRLNHSKKMAINLSVSLEAGKMSPKMVELFFVHYFYLFIINEELKSGILEKS
jgi:hypothetical protein